MSPYFFSQAFSVLSDVQDDEVRKRTSFILYSLSLLKWNSRKRLVPSPYSKLSTATSTQIPKHETTKKGCAIRAIFVWPWKLVAVSVRSLFYQPMDEKIKTWPLLFPAKENPNMALFDWPIVLQHDVKAKYRFISEKFSDVTFFPPSIRLTNQKVRGFVSVR